MNVYTDTHLTPEPWTAVAACASTDPEAFFPEHGDRVTAANAKRICATCDVAAQCLEYAIRTKQRHGIWSGRTAKALHKLRRNTP